MGISKIFQKYPRIGYNRRIHLTIPWPPQSWFILEGKRSELIQSTTSPYRNYQVGASPRTKFIQKKSAQPSSIQSTIHGQVRCCSPSFLPLSRPCPVLHGGLPAFRICTETLQDGTWKVFLRLGTSPDLWVMSTPKNHGVGTHCRKVERKMDRIWDHQSDVILEIAIDHQNHKDYSQCVTIIIVR